MPQIKFTDTTIARECIAREGKTTWYSDTETRGLQLCVTARGAKTWYLNKWDPTAKKVRRVKLGQFATKGNHTRWARSQAGAKASQIEAGEVLTREERQAQAAPGLPAFGDALDQMLAFKSNPERQKKSGRRVMSETTVRDYRGSFNTHLKQWTDIPVDQLPIFEIAQHLNALQNEKPQAAQRASAVASSIINHIARLASRELPVPKLVESTAPRSRADSEGDIDMTVPLADRWKDLMTVENEHKRLCLQLTVYGGLRGRPLRELTWDRVYQVKLEDGRKAWAVNLEKPVKKSAEDREIVLGDDAARIIERLAEIRYDDCAWVFPSRRVMGDERGSIDAIDRFGDTTVNVLRHYWMPIARTKLDLATAKWLGLHSMKASGFGMLGHYGKPSLVEQYEAQNVVASVVNNRIGLSPDNVVAIAR